MRVFRSQHRRLKHCLEAPGAEPCRSRSGSTWQTRFVGAGRFRCGGMGSHPPMTPRTVFDTNAVVSALLFSAGRLAWLRDHWKQGECVPLISHATAAELVQVLAYPKFKLSPEDRLELLGDYLPFCETVEVIQACPQTCRDPRDQAFLDLACSGGADVLVTGDRYLLALDDWTRFTIQSPESYRQELLKTL